MYARIVRDLLDESGAPGFKRKDLGMKEVVGYHFGTEAVGQELEAVRLLDDDRVVIYYAVADDEALESLATWAADDSGCTILQVLDKEGEWKDVIS